MLPMSAYIRVPERYIIISCILIALLATKSYIGITIAGIYILYIASHTLLKKYLQNITIQILVFSSAIL